MKNCINCGAEAFDEVITCANCGRDFSFIGNNKRPSGPIRALGPAMRERPDGSLLLGSGLTCLIIAPLLLLVAFGQDTNSYYGPNASALARQLAFILIAGGLFELGLILSLAGVIVRAIWFLPGAEHKAAPHSERLQAFEDRVGSPLTRPGDDGAAV